MPKRSQRKSVSSSALRFTQPHLVFLHRPDSWLAVRSRNQTSVQSALGLHHVKPCSWTEALSASQRVFISPPINGWIVILGSDLPDPADDIDLCFRFLQGTSRKMGHIQYFNSNRALNHHAWIRMESGRVIRAYAWAGRTLWNQGAKTRDEALVGMKCFGYLDSPERPLFSQADVISGNTERVPLLAAHWSFDPGALDERLIEQPSGIAGEPSRLY